nr:MAG TPA: hypothetical protein [Bacteriophage sp.]
MLSLCSMYLFPSFTLSVIISTAKNTYNHTAAV